MTEAAWRQAAATVGRRHVGWPELRCAAFLALQRDCRMSPSPRPTGAAPLVRLLGPGPGRAQGALGSWAVAPAATTSGACGAASPAGEACPA